MADKPEPARKGRPHGRAVRERAAFLFSIGQSIRAVAEETKLSTETLVRWRRDPAFMARVDELTDRAMDEQMRRATAASALALGAAIDLVRSEDPAFKAKGSREVREWFKALREAGSVEKQLREIRELLEGDHAGGDTGEPGGAAPEGPGAEGEGQGP